MANNLTALVFTYNSAAEVADCLESLKPLKAEIAAVDFESTDKTVSLLKKAGVTQYKHPHIDYVEPARDFGIGRADTDWVFIIDADERMTPELAEEINAVVGSPRPATHYKVARKEYFARRQWLRHGWWPNYQIRLIHKPSFKHWPHAIHSSPVINGSLGYLRHPLLHYSQNDWSQIVDKTVRFEEAEASLLYKAGRPVSTPIFFRKFAGELFRRLFRQKGLLDGKVGIISSIYQAFSKTITYLFLYEKKQKSGPV